MATDKKQVYYENSKAGICSRGRPLNFAVLTCVVLTLIAMYLYAKNTELEKTLDDSLATLKERNEEFSVLDGKYQDLVVIYKESQGFQVKSSELEAQLQAVQGEKQGLTGQVEQLRRSLTEAEEASKVHEGQVAECNAMKATLQEEVNQTKQELEQLKQKAKQEKAAQEEAKQDENKETEEETKEEENKEEEQKEEA